MNIDDLNLSDIPLPYKDIAEILGIKEFIKLSMLCGGGSVYIPTFDSLTKEYRNKLIRNEFTGHNYKELALKYNMTITSIRNIVNK